MNLTIQMESKIQNLQLLFIYQFQDILPKCSSKLYFMIIFLKLSNLVKTMYVDRIWKQEKYVLSLNHVKIMKVNKMNQF